MRLPHQFLRPFLAVGVLGGHTTFSTYAVGVLDTASADAAVTLLYAGLTVLAGLTAAGLGLLFAR